MNNKMMYSFNYLFPAKQCKIGIKKRVKIKTTQYVMYALRIDIEQKQKRKEKKKSTHNGS